MGGVQKARKKKGNAFKAGDRTRNTSMTDPEPGEGQAVVPTEGDEYLAGGIELHARIVEVAGKPGVDFTFEPAIHNREIPDEVAKYNRAIEDMCLETVANFPNPRSLARFYREVKKDGSRNRCWYRVTVTVRVGDDEQIKGHVSDVIDPALLRADPHVRFRARQLRAMLQRSIGRGRGGSDGGYFHD
jgi:hypothetical protein